MKYMVIQTILSIFLLNSSPDHQASLTAFFPMLFNLKTF